ncbi:hypothetical protein D3C78_1308530 [compost metagenome]
MRPFTPDQLAVLQERLLGVTTQAMAGDSVDVLMQQPGIEQFANQQGHAARRLEMVDVGFTIRVDVRQGRYHLGQFSHVLPGQLDTRSLGNRRHVQGVVGRTACGMQGDDGVNQGFFVDNLAQRHEIAAGLGHARDLLCSFDGECIA